MAKASDNSFPSLLLVESAAPATPAAGNQRLFIDVADGHLKRKDDAGTVTTVEGGGVGSPAGTAAHVRRVATGTISLGSSFAAVDSAMDLTIDAASGDLIEAVARVISDGGSGATILDAATIVSSAITSYFASGSSTPSDNGSAYANGAYQGVTMATFHRLTSGDVAAGAVTVRFIGKYAGSAKGILSDADNMVYFAIKNLGQA